MYDHPRGFVNGDDVIILIQDIERNRLWLCVFEGRDGDIHDQHVTGSDGMAGRLRPAIHSDASLFN
jgi:hypothetical protein